MSEKGHPNILIFMVDEMQGQVLSDDCQAITPHIDQLKKDGLAFTQAYTPSPHCCPSRATFMTGAYPSVHGVFNNVSNATAHQRGLNAGVSCFSEQLKDAGYDLRFCGKWHVSSEESPKDRGWTEVSVHPEDYKDLSVIEETRFSKGYITWDALTADQVSDERRPGEMLRPGWLSWPTVGPILDTYEEHGWYQSAIKPGLEEIHRLKDQDKPWCLYVGTDMEGKSPLPRQILEMYDDIEVTLPESFDDMMEDKPNIYQRIRMQNHAQLSQEEMIRARKNYWAHCTLEDCFLGELLGALKESGQEQETMVIFVSDHGDYNCAHGLNHMGIPAFKEAYHIPAIIKWPHGIVEPGRHVEDFVTLADFGPTFLDMLGGKAEDHKTGRSLMPFINNEPVNNWPDAFYSQTNGNEIYYTQRLVQTKEWKYVFNPFDFDELYDLRNDPHEMINLAHPSRGLKRTAHQLGSLKRSEYQPWPVLPDELDQVRQKLLAKMWQFMQQEQDVFFSGYMPCALAPYGPQLGMALSSTT